MQRRFIQSDPESARYEWLREMFLERARQVGFYPLPTVGFGLTVTQTTSVDPSTPPRTVPAAAQL